MTTDERVRDGLTALADEMTSSDDLFAVIEVKRLRNEHMRRNRRVFAGAAAVVAVLVVASVWMLQGGGSEHGARVATQPGETLPAPAPSVTSVPSPTVTTVPVSNDPALSDVQIADLTWISASHGWALAVRPSCHDNCAVVLTTIDGGTNWSTTSTVSAMVSHIRFASASVGYLFGPDLFLTTDGGKTWVAQAGRAVNAIEIAGTNAIRISSTHTGCPGPCDWSIDRAPVGTNNWTALRTPPITYGVGAQLVRQGQSDVYASFVGNAAGGASTAQAQLYVSHDGGDSWALQSDPCGFTGTAENDMFALAAAPGGVVAALCEPRLSDPAVPSFVIVSTDGGRTFGPAQPMPANVGPLAIAAASANDVIVSSFLDGVNAPVSGYQIRVTHDGGATWAVALNDTGSSEGLQTAGGFLGFENATTGRWVGDPRKIWTTTDGGDTWTAHTFG